MKKRWAAPLLALLCLLLSGCSPQPLPAGMEEETVLADGQAVVNLLVDGDYDAVYALLRPDVAETTDAGAIGALMESVTEDAGMYLGRQDAMVTGRTVDGAAYGEAVIVGGYEDMEVVFRLSFDTEGTLVGLDISRL